MAFYCLNLVLFFYEWRGQNEVIFSKVLALFRDVIFRPVSVTTCHFLSPAPEPRCHLSPPTAPAPQLMEKSTSCPLSASSWTPSSATRSPHPACLEASLTVSATLCFSSCLSQALRPQTHPHLHQSYRPFWAHSIGQHVQAYVPPTLHANNRKLHPQKECDPCEILPQDLL